MSLSAGSFGANDGTPFGSMSVDPLVDPDRHLRRVAGARERVQDVAGALPARVDEVERLPVEARLVGDVIDRGGDEVDRTMIGPADLEADERDHSGSAWRAFWITLKK